MSEWRRKERERKKKERMEEEVEEEERERIGQMNEERITEGGKGKGGTKGQDGDSESRGQDIRVRWEQKMLEGRNDRWRRDKTSEDR